MKLTDTGWVLSLLSLFAVLSIGTALHESATYDEPIHILAGTVAWKTGRIDLEPSNPPLAVYWQTLPLLSRTFHPFPPAEELTQIVYGYSFGFTHYNRNSESWMLQIPRAMNVILALLLGLVLFIWTEEALGRLAARGALFTYALSPIFIAYGSLVKADVGGTLGWVLTSFMAWRWRRMPHWKNAALLGLALGAALCTKYSAVLLFPAIIGSIFMDLYPKALEERPNSSVLLQSCLAFFIAMNITMILAFHGWGVPEWLHAFLKSAAQFKEGHANYYWGQIGRSGWRTYFLAAFILKTPLPFLIALASLPFIWKLHSPISRRFLATWCFWPAAVVFAAASLSTIQVGIRHILPAYAFLCIATGSAGAILWKSGGLAGRRTVLFLSLWYSVSCFLVFPRYLSYFNELVGPSSNGYKYFVDSNLDWGQGLKSLAKYLKKLGSPPIYLSYFGCADPGKEGIHFQPVLMTTCAQVGGSETLSLTQTPLYFAISATNRVGLYYQPHDPFVWLDTRKPIKIFMDSIWLYDLSNDEEAKSRLKVLTSPSRQDR